MEDILKGKWGNSSPMDSKRETVEQATSFLVEMHLGKVLVNGFRHKVAHILAGTDLRADIGGRKVHGGHLYHGDVGVVAELAVFGPWARVAVDMVMLQDILPVAPPLKGGQIVGAHDEAELLVAVLLAQMGQGEHSVAGFGQVEFGIAGPQLVVVGNGAADHLQPLVVVQQGLALLKGVLWRDHKPHLV